MGRIEKTVFISYRRTDESWGLAVFQDLTQHGYDVFIDYDGIASGYFEEVILENIRARAHFLVLLTPTALERCSDPKDWMRREIEAALDSRRNIVPLMLAGFDFDTPATASQLTGRLAALKEHNGLPVPVGYFPAAMERLRNKFLNVSVDAILHPVSDSAQQLAKEQKDKATTALEEAPHQPWSAPEDHRKQAVTGKTELAQRLRQGAYHLMPIALAAAVIGGTIFVYVHILFPSADSSLPVQRAPPEASTSSPEVQPAPPEASKQKQAISVTFTGNDPRLNLRALVMRQAIEYNLAGSAKNLPNGILQFTFQGDAERIDAALVAIFKEINKFSIGLKTNPVPVAPTLSTFTILAWTSVEHNLQNPYDFTFTLRADDKVISDSEAKNEWLKLLAKTVKGDDLIKFMEE
jgi:acylphosphatase